MNHIRGNFNFLIGVSSWEKKKLYPRLVTKVIKHTILIHLDCEGHVGNKSDRLHGQIYI